MTYIDISILSMQSLLIETFFNEKSISYGTAFTVLSSSGAPYIVTNRHNVTGRRQSDNQPLFDHGGIPNKMSVWHTADAEKGIWWEIIYSLRDDDEKPLWHEHPTLGPKADVVALAAAQDERIEYFPLNISTPQKPLRILPAEPVCAIGFPFGLTAGHKFAVWVTGFIASEMEVDYEELPRFLIDSRTRPGQSGSPVLAVRRDFRAYTDGTSSLDGTAVEFLGIYAGRIHPDSDIGIVWKRHVVQELIASLP
jgi:hypothetical protein